MLLCVLSLVKCLYVQSAFNIAVDGTGEINIGGPDGGDYDQQDDTDSDGRTDTQERRMAPTHSLLTRPGLLAGFLSNCYGGFYNNNNDNGNRYSNSKRNIDTTICRMP